MIYIANGLLILGAFVLLISSIGILRLPDFLTRIHPAAKTTTLGIIFFFAGISILEPTWAPRLLVATVLFMFTGPVSASALVRTALSEKEKLEFYGDESSSKEEK
jgi:monovalent cation/proton antiporter MnhG/PhaG subunit